MARQAPPSMGFPWQECWSGWPLPSPGGLLNPGTEPVSPALEADSLLMSHQGSPCILCPSLITSLASLGLEFAPLPIIMYRVVLLCVALCELVWQWAGG